MNYITNTHCKFCGSEMTIDEVNSYHDICYSCCSEAWSKFEKAHSGIQISVKRRAITEKTKKYILSRDKACLRCGAEDDLTIDHVIPVSLGGSNHHSNLQVLCRKCIQSNQITQMITGRLLSYEKQGLQL